MRRKKEFVTLRHSISSRERITIARLEDAHQTERHHTNATTAPKTLPAGFLSNPYPVPFAISMSAKTAQGSQLSSTPLPHPMVRHPSPVEALEVAFQSFSHVLLGLMRSGILVLAGVIVLGDRNVVSLWHCMLLALLWLDAN